jgi:triosephosphate isomerase
MKPLVVANWKMNPETLAEAKKLFNSVAKGVKNIKNAEVVICPPFVYIPHIPHTNKYNIRLGAQDCFWEEKGAYTGEISPKMLKDLGVRYVILGHSERRKYQNETDSMINRKIKAALKEGLKVILCIEMISQIKKDLAGISGKELGNLILAFEPVSAIGTGKPYSIEKAKNANFAILRSLKRNIPVLYGGSVNSQNAKNYIKEAKFQGLLIGGASLNPREFIKIIKSIDLISKI